MAAYNPLSMEQCKKLHLPLNLHHIILFYLMYFLEFFSTYLWGVVTSKLSVNSWRARNNPARKFVFFSKHHSVLGTEDLWYSLACLWPHSLSCVWPFGSPWTVACQDPLSMGFLKQEYGVGCHLLSRGPSQPRDWTHVSCGSCTERWILHHAYHLANQSAG